MDGALHFPAECCANAFHVAQQNTPYWTDTITFRVAQ